MPSPTDELPSLRRLRGTARGVMEAAAAEGSDPSLALEGWRREVEGAAFLSAVEGALGGRLSDRARQQLEQVSWSAVGPATARDNRVSEQPRRRACPDAIAGLQWARPPTATGLALLHEQLRFEVSPDRARRRSAGAWTTPPPLADIVIEPLIADRPATLLDPACGGGMLLARAVVHARRRGQAAPELYGVDVDPAAVAAARRTTLVALARRGDDLGALIDAVEQRIVLADALLDAGLCDRLRLDAGHGLDAVVGNPPFLFGEELDHARRERLRARYSLASGAFDAHQLFIERGLELLAPRGRLAMIVPDAALARDGSAALRRRCLEGGLVRVVHGGPGFRAGVAVCVLDVAPGDRRGKVEVWTGARGAPVRRRGFRPRADWLDPSTSYRLEIHTSPQEAEVMRQLAARPRLGDRVEIHRGEELGKRGLCAEGRVPVRVGEDLWPFGMREPSRAIDGLDKPAGRYRGPKVLVVKTGSRPVAAVDRSHRPVLQSVYVLRPRDREVEPDALALLLNSRVHRLWVHRRFTAYKGLFPQLNQSTLAALPLPAEPGFWPALARAGRACARGESELSRALELLVIEAFGLDSAAANTILRAPLPSGPASSGDPALREV